MPVQVISRQARGGLRAVIRLGEARLRLSRPDGDSTTHVLALDPVAHVCNGCGATEHARDEQPDRRFRRLTALRSTIVQPGLVHFRLSAARFFRLLGCSSLELSAGEERAARR